MEHRPSIVDGQLVRCSVSQIKTADPTQDGGCLRKWYYEKHDHLREPETPAMRESTKGHSIAETYLRDGFEPLGSNAIERAFLAGKHLLPAVGSVSVEHEFEGETSLAGVPFNGRMDVWDPKPQTDLMGITWVTVLDHKFLRNLERAKTGDQLERDPQMIGYGMVADALVPEITHVNLVHVNYIKEEPRPTPGARLVSRLVPLAKIRQRWHLLGEVVERMKAAAKEGTAAAIPGNKNACRAFGRKCFHFDRCHGEKKMQGFSAEELALFGGGAPAPQVVAAVKKSLIEDQSTVPDAVLIAQRLTGGPQAGAYPTDGPGWIEVTCKVCSHSFGKRPPGHTIADSVCPNAAHHAAVAARILPPDAPVSNPLLAAACPACETEKKNFQHLPVDCPKKDAVAGEPKKRGRKPKEPSLVDMIIANQKEQAAHIPLPAQPTAVPEATVTYQTVALLTPSEYAKQRDVFALAAITGAVSSDETIEWVAFKAYAIADAMLKVRNG